MTIRPKYYFNLDANITDGEKEYSLENIEDRIGGLSINSGLKDNYVLYGRNSLLDLINNLNDENEQLKKELDRLCEVEEHGVDFANKVLNAILSTNKRDLTDVERIFFNNLLKEMEIDLND